MNVIRFASQRLLIVCVILASYLTCLSRPDAVVALCAAPREEGTWVNRDSSTRSIARVQVLFDCKDTVPRTPGPTWKTHLFGACSPTDCDWGEAGGEQNKTGYIYTFYNQGYAKRYVYTRMSQRYLGNLYVYIWTDFVDPSRSDYKSENWFRLSDPSGQPIEGSEPPQSHGVLSFYSDNNVTGEVGCTLKISNSYDIGMEDFRENSCKNNEANSLLIENALAGSEIWIYDNADCTQQDATTRIQVRKQVPSIKVNSFQRSYLDDNVDVAIIVNGTIDDVVSCVTASTHHFGSVLTYKLLIKTGRPSGGNGGTNSDVLVQLIGKDATSDTANLDIYDYNDFEEGDSDLYDVLSSYKIGTPDHINVRLDGSDGWFLESITVVDSKSGESWLFTCNRWFADDEDDGKRSRTLYLNRGCE